MCTSGVSFKPLGTVRLRIAELFHAIIRLENNEINDLVISSNVFQKVFELFKHYTQNTFLHQVVESIIRHIFSTESCSKLRTHLIKDQKIIDFLLDC
jgi:hypothetical protein